jgi:hypothetical protein
VALTLFIVRDEGFNDLPSDVAEGTLAELKRLFSFLHGFAISVVGPEGFPERLDFTDAVVKIVISDEEITAAQNQAFHLEWHNVVTSARRHGVKLIEPPHGHVQTMPDRGGLSFMQKDIVDPANAKLILTITGGVASIETAKEEVIEFATEELTAADIQRSRKERIEGTPRKPGVGMFKYFASYQALTDSRQLATLDLLKRKGWGDWPQDLKDKAALALGRLIAHEARHQYIAPHSESGVGAESAPLIGQKNFESFEKGDQSAIAAKIADLKTKQRGGKVHLDIFPRGEIFPFN